MERPGPPDLGRQAGNQTLMGLTGVLLLSGSPMQLKELFVWTDAWMIGT